MTVSKDWDGIEWQRHIDLLLLRHHGPGNYQRIPDTVSGDAGLEGFCRKSGYAYQCYAAQGVHDTKKLYEKQRNKISTDIGKLIGNKAKLVALLGSVKISRWILVVPYFNNKEILNHAAVKTAEVVRAGLSYVDVGFSIQVIDDNAFAVERQSLVNASLVQLRIPFASTDPVDVANFQAAHNTLISNLDRKLHTLLADDLRRKAAKEHLLRHHLDGQAALQHMRTSYPDTYSAMLDYKRIREGYLETERLFAGPAKTLQAEMKDYRDRLVKDIKGLSEAQADVFAWEAVVDWLLRCPLDFG